MDKIYFTCTECGGRFRIGAELAGKKIRCPKCKAVVTVPAGDTPARPAVRAEPPTETFMDKSRPVPERRVLENRVPERRAEAPSRPRPAPRSAEGEPKIRKDGAPRRQSAVLAVLILVLLAGYAGLVTTTALGVLDDPIIMPQDPLAKKDPFANPFGNPFNNPARPPDPFKQPDFPINDPLNPIKKPDAVVPPANPQNPPEKPAAAPPLPRRVVDHELGYSKEFSGTVKFDSHPFEVQAGALYLIEAKGTGWRPRLRMTETYPRELGFDFNQPHFVRASFSPLRGGPEQLLVFPEVPLSGAARPGKYTLKLIPFEFEKEPVLDVKETITANDPRHPNRGTFHKSYSVKMKAGKFYVIDHMNEAGKNIDPYLHLESSDRKELASDDDGGGNLNSRIIWQATEDEDNRIIATTLGMNVTGPFHLRVRVGTPDHEKTKEFSGEVSVASHTVPMTRGEIYWIDVKGEGWRPELTARNALLRYGPFNFAQNAPVEASLTPREDGSPTVFVLPTTPARRAVKADPLKYTLRITHLPFDQDPILGVATSLTPQDPTLPNGQSYFKSFDVNMKAGHYYLIDMVNPPTLRMATSLILMNATQQAQADFGSINSLDSRIVFKAPQTGTYRVLATTQRRTTGPFYLYVREQGKINK